MNTGVRKTILNGLIASLLTFVLSALVLPMLGWVPFARGGLSGLIGAFLVLLFYNCMALREK